MFFRPLVWSGILVTVVLSLALNTSAIAQSNANSLQVSLSAYKVEHLPNGKEKLTPAQKVSPGDTLEYAATYRNQSKAIVRDVYATLPIPSGGMTYLANSARPTQVEASIDGVSYGGIPLMRSSISPTGSIQMTEIPLEEYRYLRWPLGNIEAGKSQVVRARMRL